MSRVKGRALDVHVYVQGVGSYVTANTGRKLHVKSQGATDLSKPLHPRRRLPTRSRGLPTPLISHDFRANSPSRLVGAAFGGRERGDFWRFVRKSHLSSRKSSIVRVRTQGSGWFHSWLGKRCRVLLIDCPIDGQPGRRTSVCRPRLIWHGRKGLMRSEVGVTCGRADCTGVLGDWFGATPEISTLDDREYRDKKYYNVL